MLDDLGGDQLANEYYKLLDQFITRFSLRYDLRRPCKLCPTLPGVFASLIQDVRMLVRADPHLSVLLKEFERAIRDLRDDDSDDRIKTCIQKQINLLEGIGRACPGVTATELGGICEKIETWPHLAVRASLKSLYGFASDYPGIRHAGTPKSAKRPIDMRDFVAVSVLLAGFTPYLNDKFDGSRVYRGTE